MKEPNKNDLLDQGHVKMLKMIGFFKLILFLLALFLCTFPAYVAMFYGFSPANEFGMKSTSSAVLSILAATLVLDVTVIHIFSKSLGRIIEMQSYFCSENENMIVQRISSDSEMPVSEISSGENEPKTELKDPEPIGTPSEK